MEAERAQTKAEDREIDIQMIADQLMRDIKEQK